MKIGVAISTYGRPEVFAETYANIKERLPKGAELVVVSDGGVNFDPPAIADFAFKERVGIPRVKNKCLELLIDAGCDQLFLFDDDTYPIHEDWWKPYVQHPEPHLMYIFGGFGNQTRGIHEIHRDDKTVAYDHVRGCMLYYDKKVIDVVGGFDTDYGLGMYEHTDLTNRIHNAGLTTFRVMDVPDSNKLIYSMDEHQEVGTTFDPAERRRLIRVNKQMKLRKSASKEYRPFR